VRTLSDLYSVTLGVWRSWVGAAAVGWSFGSYG